jgi:hypothetical protein
VAVAPLAGEFEASFSRPLIFLGLSFVCVCVSFPLSFRLGNRKKKKTDTVHEAKSRDEVGSGQRFD